MEYKGSKIQIQVQPASFVKGANKYLSVLVDGEEEFSSNGIETHFKSWFRIETENLQVYVDIKTEDNGPSVQCSYLNSDGSGNDNSMNCYVYLPPSYQVIGFA